MITSAVLGLAVPAFLADSCAVAMTDFSSESRERLSINRLRLKGMRHVLRPDPFVELRRGQITQLQRRVTEREFLPVGLERNLRRLLVSDMRIQCGHQHERVVEMLVDALAVGLDTLRTTVVERLPGFSQ